MPRRSSSCRSTATAIRKTDFDQAAQQPCHDAVAQATGNDTDFLAFRLRPEENVWKDDGGDRVLCFAIRKDGGSIDDLPNNSAGQAPAANADHRCSGTARPRVPGPLGT